MFKLIQLYVLIFMSLQVAFAQESELPRCAASDIKDNCFGEAFNNGSRYVGEFKNGKPHGQGKLTWRFNQYIGEFKEGRFDGQGTLNYKSRISADLGTYVGSFKDGKRSGNGVMNLPDDDVFTGEYLNDLRHGKGVMKYKGGKVYEGEYRFDKEDGQGVLLYENGDKYIGLFEKGVPTKQGEMIYRSMEKYGSATSASAAKDPLEKLKIQEAMVGKTLTKSKLFYCGSSSVIGINDQNKLVTIEGLYITRSDEKKDNEGKPYFQNTCFNFEKLAKITEYSVKNTGDSYLGKNTCNGDFELKLNDSNNDGNVSFFEQSNDKDSVPHRITCAEISDCRYQKPESLNLVQRGESGNGFFFSGCTGKKMTAANSVAALFYQNKQAKIDAVAKEKTEKEAVINTLTQVYFCKGKRGDPLGEYALSSDGYVYSVNADGRGDEKSSCITSVTAYGKLEKFKANEGRFTWNEYSYHGQLEYTKTLVSDNLGPWGMTSKEYESKYRYEGPGKIFGEKFFKKPSELYEGSCYVSYACPGKTIEWKKK